MSSKPKQAPRLARPVARYWAGKAPRDHLDSESDSNDDDEEQQGVEDEGVVNMGGEQDFTQGEPEEEEDQELSMKQDIAKTKSMNIALRDVNISRDGKVIVAGRVESGRTAVEEDEESEEESEEDIKPKIKAEHEEYSSEYESGSEEEKPRLQFRPVFVSKRNRETVSERDKIAQDSEEALKRKELEQEERRKQSHDMVAESIRRELAEKEKEEEVPDIDDIDGLDPEGEFEAWRLRELGRIKKEKEEMIIRDQEREEIERRRAMPEEQRLKEDLERAQKLRDEKPKGQQKFLQKYWHKGAFHQDEEILKGRDFTEATESTVDVSLLPKVMQVKNFGKRSRTKYTHLLDQDTTVPTGGFGGTAPVKAGGKSTETGGCFTCGGPHLKKDCPQNTGPLSQRSGTGANSIGSGGSRQWGGSWKDRDEGETRRGSDSRNGGDERYPDHRKGGNRWSSRSPYRRHSLERERFTRRRSSTSRSRSPPRRRKDSDERARRRPRSKESSLEREYGSKDKRRRVE